MLDMEFKSMTLSGKPTSVPLIDFSELSDPAKRSSVCAQVARACETVGFFEIINSGFPLEAIENAFDVSREFFDLPMEEKLTLMTHGGIFQPGYKHFPVMKGVENRVEEMVFLHYHMQETNSPDLEDADPQKNRWPNNPGGYRVKVERLGTELGKVGDTLLDVFSESLGLPPTYLREHHHTNATVPRCLNFHHYPKATESKEAEPGIIPHRDSSIFSIVSQGYDTMGLQVNPYGEWIPVLPQRGGLIVNIGDILEAWTNGRYRSILHQVISNKEAGRHSFAYFLFPATSPDSDYVIQPISKLITKENPPTFTPFSYADFFRNKVEVNSVSLLKTHEIIINA